MLEYDVERIIKLTKKEILVYLQNICSQVKQFEAENGELRILNAELECTLSKKKGGRKAALSQEVIESIKHDIIEYHAPINWICEKYNVSRQTLVRYHLTKKELLNGEHI